MGDLSIGQSVSVKNEPGIIRYIGETQFAVGIWIGVELQNAVGKNNGTVNGVHYFDCNSKDEQHGIFVRETLINTGTLAEAKVSNVQGLENIINRLQDKLRNANGEIKVLKQEIEELQNKLEESLKFSLTLESNIEMITVDKEFLEESNTKVTSALKELQQKYNELQTDFQIMLEEMELNRQIEEEIKQQMEQSEVSVPEIQSILLRNKLLELALASLRKVTDENETNLRLDIKDLTKRLSNSENELESQNELLKKLSTAQETINSLQNQLDSALQLENLIEHLSVENDGLSSKITSLTKTIEELTELHELDKSLEENQSLVERDLRSEIYNLSTVIKNNESLILELNRTNKYMESKMLELKNNPNDKMGDSIENLDELNMQLETLQLEYRKAKSSNTSYQITHDIINAKLEVLQSYIGLPNFKFKDILDILVNFKKTVSITSIISSNIDSLLDEKTSYNRSTLFTISTHFKALTFFLLNTSMLLEYDYNNKEYKEVSTALYDLTSELLLKVDKSALSLIDGNYEGIRFDYIIDFLLKAAKLLNFRFTTDNDKEALVQNSLCFKFLLEASQNEASVSLKIIRIFKTVLSQYKDENFDSLNKELESLLSRLWAQEAEFNDLIYKLDSELKGGNEVIVNILPVIDFVDYLTDITSVTDLLSGILSQLESEDRLKNNTFPSDLSMLRPFDIKDNGDTSNSQLDLINQTLTKRDPFVGMQIKSSKKIQPDIYTVLKNENILPELPSESDKSEKALQSMKPKIAELSSKLLEKEKLILELELNIKFLKESLESASIRNKNDVNKLKNELDAIKIENDDSNERYQEAIEENRKLEKEIGELLRSSVSGDTLHKFTDLQSENNFNTNIALFDEIKVLKRLVVYNLNAYHIPNYEWLKQPLLMEKKCTSSVALDFVRGYRNLRHISEHTQAVNICFNSGAWRPKVSIPKYITALLEENTNNYIEQKKLSLS